MCAVWQSLRSPIAVSVVASTLVWCGIIGLRRTGYLESVELTAYDWSMRWRPTVMGSDPPIVLIGITEQDIRAQGHWPLTDATLVEVLDRLIQHRPRAIGLDLFRDIPVPPGRAALEVMLARHRHIIAVMKVGEGGAAGVPPPPMLAQTEQVGFNDIPVDPDGIVRRGLLFVDDGGAPAHAFALRLALHYLQAEGITPRPDATNPEHLRLGPTTIRPLESHDGGYVGMDARGYQFLLDFPGGREPFPTVPLTALLAGDLAPEAIHDKIILIGITAESVKDFFYTPYSGGLRANHHLSGIGLHAQIVSQLLEIGLGGRAPVTVAPKWQEGLWIWLWSVMGGVLGLRARGAWRFTLGAVSGLLLLSLAVVLTRWHGWWIPWVPPAMTWLLAAAVVTAYMSRHEKGQRALLMQLFSAHVSPEVAEVLWQQRARFLDGGRPRSQQVHVTVLFSDLRGFTTIAETMAPQALMDWLNAYLETMTQVVMAHGGVIDDYAGDGVKANFGVPLARTTDAEIRQDAVNAVQCALVMACELNRLNVRWQAQHLPMMEIRIGIFTGPAVAGSLGSARRLKYTTVGDTVNTAARLESAQPDPGTPQGSPSPCRILIGDTTARYVTPYFSMHHIGEIQLRGKEQPITVYRVVGRADGQARGGQEEERK
jgi:adenylate cyclase